MNQLTKIIRAANISPDMLAEAMGMPIRTLSYQFTTGRIPYSIVYKIHLVTGIEMDQLVPKFVAENWLFLYDEQNKVNKPRGKRKWQSIKPIAEKIADVPKTVTTDIPKTVSAPRGTSTAPKKKSIADLMKDAPAPEPVEEGAPDFSNIDDSVFSTSMDVANNAARRKR